MQSLRRPGSQNPIVSSLLPTDRIDLLRPTESSPSNRNVTITYEQLLVLLQAALDSGGFLPPQAERTADYTASAGDAWALMPFDLSAAVADVTLMVPAAADAAGLAFFPLRTDTNIAVRLLIVSLGGTDEINYGNELAVLGQNEKNYIQSNGTIYYPY